MLSGAVSILSNLDRPEQRVLNSLKTWVKHHPQASLEGLLEKSIERGFTQVLEYLIKVKKCNPDIKNGHNQTALNYAIEKKQEKAALCLLKYTTDFSGDEYEITPLHFALKKGLLEIAKALIETCPFLINRQTVAGETPLLIAAKKNQLTVIECLLQRNTLVNLCEVTGKTAITEAFSHGNMKAMEMLLSHSDTIPIAFDWSSQTQMYLDFLKQDHIKNKVGCLNALFSSGAGLELSHIPDEVFTLLKLKRSQLKEFIIVAERKNEDGEYKKCILTSLESIGSALKDDSWRLNVEKIERACTHPLLVNLPQVIELKALLSPLSQASNIEESMPLMIDKTPFKEPELDEISARSKEDLILSFKVNGFLLKHFKSDITDKMMELYSCALFSDEDDFTRKRSPRFDELLYLYFVTLNKLIENTHHSMISLIGTKERMALDIVFDDFCDIFRNFVAVFRRAPFIDFSKRYVPLIQNYLRQILKFHGKALKHAQKNAGLYNSLVDAHALICIMLARQELNAKNNDVALTYALQAMQINETLVINNDNLDEAVKQTKALCAAIITEVYMQHNWINKAYRYILKALEWNPQSGFEFDNLLFTQSLELSERLAKHNKPIRGINLLEETSKTCDSLQLMFLDREKVEAFKHMLYAKHALLVKEFFSTRVSSVLEIFKGLAIVNANTEEYHIKLSFYEQQFNPTNLNLLRDFLEKHTHFGNLIDNYFLLNKDCLFVEAFLGQLKKLKAIMQTEHVVQEEMAIEEAELITEFSRFNVQDIEPEPIQEMYGFEPLTGFIPITPIFSDRIPKNTLFMTMPKDDETFAPFYKLIRNKDIRVISNGANEQGMKLATKTNENGKKEAYGRLKIFGKQGVGALRAHGYVEQTVIGENGKQRKLYVFREVFTKKEEKRSKYFL